MIDPRTPVLVGVGQSEQRIDDPADALEPIDLLAGAADAALDDSGAAGVLRAAVDTIAVVQIASWPYPDPGALLARRLGTGSVRRTVVTTVGGNSPQLLVNELASQIAAGGADVVLIGGGECMRTRWRARREPKVWLDWSTPADPPCPVVIGDDRAGSSEYEIAHMAVAPIQVYPLLEAALRAAAHEGIDEHQVRVSDLWSGFSEVAASNPHAWSRSVHTPEQIRTVGPENRMVSFPYTKLMCANMGVDQAAALVMCSYERAQAAGVADDRLVFPLAGADAHDHFFFSERDRLDTSPAIQASARAATDAVGIGVDDIARFDLYSCFPAAVEIAMNELGLTGDHGGDARPLTVTGGLGFAGGPVNNYPTHAIAAMAEACRSDPGSTGFVSALGWFATKHSVGLYSTDPPQKGYTRVDPTKTQATVDRLPSRATAGAYRGSAAVEATTVVFDRDGAPSVGIVSALTSDGERALANVRDPGLLLEMTEQPWEGRVVELRNDGSTNSIG